MGCCVVRRALLHLLLGYGVGAATPAQPESFVMDRGELFPLLTQYLGINTEDTIQISVLLIRSVLL